MGKSNEDTMWSKTGLARGSKALSTMESTLCQTACEPNTSSIFGICVNREVVIGSRELNFKLDVSANAV